MERLVEEGHSQNESSKEIIDVLVYLDEVPEMMTGVYRVGRVEIMYADEPVNSCNELVDNNEYFSEEDMMKAISKRLNVDPEIVHLD